MLPDYILCCNVTSRWALRTPNILHHLNDSQTPHSCSFGKRLSWCHRLTAYRLLHRCNAPNSQMQHTTGVSSTTCSRVCETGIKEIDVLTWAGSNTTQLLKICLFNHMFHREHAWQAQVGKQAADLTRKHKSNTRTRAPRHDMVNMMADCTQNHAPNLHIRLCRLLLGLLSVQ